MLLTLRCKPVLIDLAIVVEIVEHQIEVVVHLLSQVIDHALLPVDHYFHIVLLLNHRRILVASLVCIHVVAE